MVKAPLPPDKNDARAPDRNNIWFSAPALWTVIGSLVTAAIGAAITGYWNNSLEHEKFVSNTKFERRKFKSELIQKALEGDDDSKKASRLTFLAKAGLIDDYSKEVLNTLPTFLGAAIRDHITTVGEVKKVFHQIGLHTGPIDEVADEAFRKEVVEFQSSRGLPPDGYVGKDTYAKLS